MLPSATPALPSASHDVPALKVWRVLVPLFVWLGGVTPIVVELHAVTLLPQPFDALARIFLAVRNDPLPQTVLAAFMAVQSVLLCYLLKCWSKTTPLQSATLAMITVLSLAGLIHYLASFESTAIGLRSFYFYWGLCFALAALAFSSVAPTMLRRQLWYCWAAVVVLSFIVSCTGLPHAGYYRFQGQLRWPGVFINPNLYGAFAAGSVVYVTFVLTRREAERHPLNQSLWQAVLFSVLGVISFFGLINSYSRSAWLGALIGLVALGRHARFGKAPAVLQPLPTVMPPAGIACTSNVRKRDRWLKLGIVFAIIMVGIATLGKKDQLHTIIGRSATLVDSGDKSVSNRSKTWGDAMPMVFSRGLGWGWGNWRSTFDAGFRHSGQTSSGSLVLNDHLSMGIVYGWPVGLLWLAALALWLVKTFRDPDRTLEFALLLSLIPTSIANNVIFSPSLGFIWWFLLVGAALDFQCGDRFPRPPAS